MNKNTLYIKIAQNVDVTSKKVLLQDIAKLYSVDKQMILHLGELQVYLINNNTPSKYMFSILKIIELIHEEYPDITIVNLGEDEFVVNYISKKQSKKYLEYIKVALVAFTIFFGSAFSIMTFNVDCSVDDVFNKCYELIMGVQKKGGSILEISYSIGLPIGIIVFFNHFTKLKVHNDPSPLQIEMRKYEKDINSALIEDSSREGKTIDID
jgi:stage V sporulation protein AA